MFVLEIVSVTFFSESVCVVACKLSELDSQAIASLETTVVQIKVANRRVDFTDETNVNFSVVHWG